MTSLARLSSRAGLLPGPTPRLATATGSSDALFCIQKRKAHKQVVGKSKSVLRQQTKSIQDSKKLKVGDGGKKNEKGLGAFMAMSPKQLSHPLFESANRTPLTLPVFGQDPLDVAGAMEFAASEDDPFRRFGLPRSMLLEFRMLSKPCSVVRDVTVTTTDMLRAAADKSSMHTRAVMTGPAGCGKSFLLLQALEYCVSQNWIVLYVPRAADLVNSSSTYTYDMRTQVYAQPTFARQTLLRFLTVNRRHLDGLVTSREVAVERRDLFPAGTPLVELINVGVKDQGVAPTVLDAVLAELGTQKKFPVLLAVDDFQALYCTSTYRDPLFSRIKPYHLSMPRLLLEYASGMRTFARGAVLGAVSRTNAQFPVPLELREALRLSEERPTNARVTRAATFRDYASGLRSLPVPAQLSLDEAAALFEVWMKDRALYGVTEDAKTAADESFLAKYTESNGNPRNFVRHGLLASLAWTTGV